MSSLDVSSLSSFSGSVSIQTLTLPEKRMIAMVGVCGGFGGFLFGYNTSIIAGALLPLSDRFSLSDIQQSIVVSIISLGSLVGSYSGGYASDYFGRKKTMLVQDALFLVASVILLSATSVSSLFIGRFIAGLGAGVSIVADVPYLNEISPARYRGRLASFYEIQVVLGTVAGSVASIVLVDDWRVAFGVPVVFVALHMLGLVLIPESPRWLVQNHRRREAKEALKLLLLIDDDDRLDAELIRIETILHSSNTPATSRQSSLAGSSDAPPLASHPHSLLYNEYAYPLRLVLALMVLAQLTGSVVIRNFTPTIFVSAGFSFAESLLLNLIVSVVNSVFVIASSSFLDKRGRKQLLLMGVSITMLGTLVLAAAFFSGTGKLVEVYLTACLLTTIGFSVGFGTVGWLLSSELFPTVIRGQALALSTVVRNAFEFLTNFLFLLAVNGTGAGATFLLFFLLGGVSLVFVRLLVVETKQKEPHEILAELHAQYQAALLPLANPSKARQLEDDALPSSALNPLSSFLG